MHGWGRFPVVDAVVREARDHAEIERFAAEDVPQIPFGNRRSYGDACLASTMTSIRALRSVLEFDRETGVVHAEAGCTIGELIAHVLPEGWFPFVTPGTKHATIGGCVAADVHGKNHHVDGAFGRFVDRIEMVLASGSAVTCSRDENEDLFRATLGGMGLTGFITSVVMRLRRVESAYIRRANHRAPTLDAICDLLESPDGNATYSVAWIDGLARGRSLGRGFVSFGEHAGESDVPQGAEVFRPAEGRVRTLHRDAPTWLLSKFAVRWFNRLCYYRPRRPDVVSYEPYFYPLDSLDDWNRLYGKSGFVQYQVAVPFEGARDLLREILERIAAGTRGPFLGVLKTFGERGEGILSFPIPGFTLAIDFPCRGPQWQPTLRACDELVASRGGRVYLAKDAVTDPDTFARMAPELDKFRRIQAKFDPEGTLRSAQSKRLGLVP